MIKSNFAFEIEGFTKQKNARPGTKFGFIGLGQGGSKIVDAFASIRNPVTGDPVYQVICFNTNAGDLDSLVFVDKNNRVAFKGREFEHGAGMNPEKGQKALEENGEIAFNEIQRALKDSEVIVVVASLGGGTGTGSLNLMIDVCADYIGKPVMAIVTLPSPHIDENINAFNALKDLVPKLEEIREDQNGNKYRVLENLIILDNKKIIDEHIKAIENGDIDPAISWDRYSNTKCASILHEWNVTTTLESDKTLDAEDFKNKLLFTGGVLTFAKKKIHLQENDLRSETDLINEVVSTYQGTNVLANGFDYSTDAKAFGLHVVMPKNFENLMSLNTLEKIHKRLQQELPDVPIYYGRSTWDSKHALVYTITSLRGLPERAKKLKEESEELIQKQRERELKQSGFNISGELTRNGISTTRERSVNLGASNPFKAKSEVSATSDTPSKINPFKRS